MRKQWLTLPFRLTLLTGLLSTVGEALICYSCTSPLADSIEEKAQVALRVFLDASYNLPPVNQLCDKEHDLEFKTVQTTQCALNDKCIKIESQSNDVSLVLRGCASHIYRENVAANRNLPCVANGSPSLCFCETNLCNGAISSKITAVNTVAMLEAACFTVVLAFSRRIP